jgi:hypothetical protein
MAPKNPRMREPDFPYERALPAIRRQLERLQSFKGRAYDEAATEFTGWKQFTQSVVERTFGNPSSELNQYFSARSAGQYNLGGMPRQQLQSNFEQKISEFETLLQSYIEMIELVAPQAEIKGTYEPGEEYIFYRDLSAIIEGARSQVMIVDAYLNEGVFNLYVEKVAAGVRVRILSNRIGPNVETVARMYASSGALELRSSTDIHDRVLLVDDRAWVIGQSLKDAAKTKPTYLIELQEPALTALRDAHETAWTGAHVIV